MCWAVCPLWNVMQLAKGRPDRMVKINWLHMLCATPSFFSRRFRPPHYVIAVKTRKSMSQDNHFMQRAMSINQCTHAQNTTSSSNYLCTLRQRAWHGGVTQTRMSSVLLNTVDLIQSLRWSYWTKRTKRTKPYALTLQFDLQSKQWRIRNLYEFIKILVLPN